MTLAWVLAMPLPSLAWWEAGHASRVRATAYAPDGRAIASASEDSTVKLWSPGGRLLNTLSFHPTPATAVAFSPDSHRLAVGTYGGDVEVFRASPDWNSETAPVRESVHRNSLGQILSLAFSVDGKWFASGGVEGSNLVRQVTGGALVAQWPGYSGGLPSASAGVAFARNGRLASVSRDGTVRVWEDPWREVWSVSGEESGALSAVAFSPDGSRLAEAVEDGTIRVRDGATGVVVSSLAGHTNSALALAFRPDGAVLVSGGRDGTIRLWDLSTGVCRNVLRGHEGVVTSVAFAPDGDTLVSGSADRTVRLWSLTEGRELGTLGRRGGVRGVAISSDGSQVACWGEAGTVELRDADDGDLRGSLPAQGDWLSAACFSPDAAWLACGGGPADGSVQLWRVRDGVLVQRLAGHPHGVTSLAFSPDGGWLAMGGDASDRTIQLWKLGEDTPARTLPGHTHGVTALAFSPAGDFLVSGGRRLDATLRIWRPTEGALTRTLAGHAGNIEALAISPNGRLLASGSSGDGPLRIWDWADGSGRSLPTSQRWVASVAFSPDGAVLAAVSGEALEFWDSRTGQLRTALTREASRVASLAFSPNGNLLVLGREDASVGVLATPLDPPGQPPLHLGRPSLGSAGEVLVPGLGRAWTTYRMEGSSDLASWRFVTNAVSATGELQVREVLPETGGRQFYRALTPP